MITYEHCVKVSRGFPLLKKSLDEFGQEGWRLAGVVRHTTIAAGRDIEPHPVDEFLYYFVREEAT